MAFIKKLQQELGGGKKSGHMDGLKNWVMSPGGVVTIIGFIAMAWYVHHRTK